MACDSSLPRPRERRRENIFRNEHRVFHRFVGVGRARFPNQMIDAIHFVMPRTAMPVIVAGEIENAGIFHLERNIEVIGNLISNSLKNTPAQGWIHVIARRHEKYLEINIFRDNLLQSEKRKIEII